MPWQTPLLSRFERGVWLRECFKNKAHFLVTNPFLISFEWCKAIYCRKCDWYYIYQSLQGLAHSSLPWRNSSRNVWEGCSLSHHPCTCGTTGKWGLKGCVTLAWFQDPDPRNICRAGRREPSVLLRAEPRAHSAHPNPQPGAWQQPGSLKAFSPARGLRAVEQSPAFASLLPPLMSRAQRMVETQKSPRYLKWGSLVWKKKHSHLKATGTVTSLMSGGSWAAISRRGCCLLNTHLHTQTHTPFAQPEPDGLSPFLPELS